jgi:dipeptidase E
MQKHLFLTSSIHLVAQDIAAKLDLTQQNKLVFITTPAEAKLKDDHVWEAVDRKALVDAGFAVSDYTITGKNKSQLESDLSGFDYIYVSGGDIFYLLKQAEASGFTEVVRNLILQQGKTYIGTSCGTIVAGPKPHAYLLEELNGDDSLKGFNFVNFLIIPHWGTAYRVNKYQGRLDTTYRESYPPVVILSDLQYIEVTGENLKIIDLAQA